VDYLIDLTIVGLSLGMVYGLVALGISFIYSGLDIVHFAHGEIYMIGAFLGVTVLNGTQLPGADRHRDAADWRDRRR